MSTTAVYNNEKPGGGFGFVARVHTPAWANGRIVDGAGIAEFPITTIRFGNTNRPCGGGGFFRLFPYMLSRWVMRRINRQDGQPGIPNISAKTKFRHYLNLGRLESGLRHLTKDFAWGRMDRVFDVQYTGNS